MLATADNDIKAKTPQHMYNPRVYNYARQSQLFLSATLKECAKVSINGSGVSLPHPLIGATDALLMGSQENEQLRNYNIKRHCHKAQSGIQCSP